MDLAQLIEELEKNISNANKIDQSISQRGVDWHIDHSLKVIIGVIKSLIKSEEKDYKWKFNFIRLVCLTLAYFPKGKAKAPKVVNNREEIQLADLSSQLQLVKELLANKSKLKPQSNFKHPYFGLLNLKQSQRFLAIHTKHHLKIIEEIINANR